MANVPTKGSTPQLDALAAFTESATPSNAVALAIADHRAGALTDWTYVDALRKAQERLEAYPKLVTALREAGACGCGKWNKCSFCNGSGMKVAVENALRELGESS